MCPVSHAKEYWIWLIFCQTGYHLKRYFKGTTNVTRMDEEKSPDDYENDNNNDYIEEAKFWALKQKQKQSL